ncbi:MAG: hypothetical protein OEM81_13675 [Acidimicrobiia bacterium]|nr:hypothetical protein [Acidimicrobiia bacterium]MDH3398861.1 hypothetical protein [Acidimicrobiia bacterium]MDH5615008.1 hypothetical protein [Acidimicrobiia bacterium]
MIRTLVLRILGLLVAAALGLTATSLLTFGLERRIPWLSDGIRSLADWVYTPPKEGAAVLAGTGLLLLAIAIVIVAARSRIRGVRNLEKTAAGSTDIDMGSVADTLEGSLRAIDPKVKINSRRNRLRVSAPPGSGDRFEVADEASRRVREALGQLGLADTPFSVNVRSARETRVT